MKLSDPVSKALWLFKRFIKGRWTLGDKTERFLLMLLIASIQHDRRIRRLEKNQNFLLYGWNDKPKKNTP